MISGPYYRLHCDAERCGALEDFDVSDLPLSPELTKEAAERNEQRFARALAAKMGWSRKSHPNYGPSDDDDLCPRCTEKYSER